MNSLLQLASVLVLSGLSQAQTTAYTGISKGNTDVTTIATAVRAGLNYGSALVPPRCVIGASCESAVTPGSGNKIFYASDYAGADVGAKINAADVAAGSGPADIQVTTAGNVSTAPTISSNHRLVLSAPLNWMVAPVLKSDTQIIGTGSNAVQTVHSLGGWIVAVGLSNLEIDDLWVTNASTPVAEGAAILACGPCANVVMNDNHGVKIGIFFSGSGTQYGSISTANLTTNVSLTGNQVDGQETTLVGSNRVITLANLGYAQHVNMVGNDAYQAEYNVEWWGGNAALEGYTLANPRWASDIKISGGRSTNVQAGWWGSMGQNITVTGVTADTCLDVCLDAESSTDVVFSGFTVRNSGNGALATFFGSVDNEFGPGTVTSDTADSVLMFLHNVSADPTRSSGVKIHHVKFICLDPESLCKLKADPIASLQFNDNELTNSTLTFVQTNNSGFEISRNHFGYTFVPGPFSAIKIPGQIFNYRPISVIGDNTLVSSVSQPAGTFAIDATITDFNFGDILLVRDNTTQGFTNDAKFVANSGNTGISPVFVLTNNRWGKKSITKAITGTLGRFIGSG